MTTSDIIERYNSSTSSERISVPMLEENLAQVISAWFGEHDLPPDEWDELDPYIENMRLGLSQDGDLGAFRIGLQALLDAPGLDLSRLNAGQSDYDHGEMRQILGHILGRLGHVTELKPDQTMTAVLDWNESAEDWWVRHGVLHRLRAGDTLRSIAAEHKLPLTTLLERNPYYRQRYAPDVALPVEERIVRVGAG